MYIIRLDDASDHMNYANWIAIKELFDRYGIKPIVGIIPDNKDPDLLIYDYIADFWELIKQWTEDGWIPALHGYNHIFESIECGINPVHNKSEFAGLALQKQREKIRNGYKILKEHGIDPHLFFAPAHTYDETTLTALQLETDIRIICDTIAYDVYYKTPFFFIPQQSGRVRKLPFKTVTFCYHPNTMNGEDFILLEAFIRKHIKKFERIELAGLKNRRKGLFDKIIEFLYFYRRRSRHISIKRGNI